MKTSKLVTAILIILVVGVVGILLLLSFSNLTTRETGLLSTLLSLLSILAAWMVSHIYSESQHKSAIGEAKEAHQENLRTFALKAAEKVTNLSDQISHVISFLEDELQNSEFETNQELINSREQRIESCVHMLSMLKSMNDTSLSDWQGIIGEELEEQREEKAEREEQIIELTNRLESLLEGQKEALSEHLGSKTGVDKEIHYLRKDLERLIANISGSRPKLRVARRTTRKDVSQNCPVCNATLTYRQRTKIRSIKPVRCSNCSSELISKYNADDDDFYLEKREDLVEKIECPSCQALVDLKLNNFPGATSDALCESCDMQIRAVRQVDGSVRVKSLKKKVIAAKELTEEFICDVKYRLPPQPWEKHIHKIIASELGVSNSMVQRAIRHLIDKGEFHEQINGELFKLVPVSESKKES